MEKKVSVVIPNYNGLAFYRDCLLALREQTRMPDRIVVIDNGSTDQSAEAIEREFPEVELLRLETNTGFCGAVNAGIIASYDMDYVILLNNDTKADPRFVEELLTAIMKNDKIFSCQAKMLSMADPSLIDDAGDYYCAFGWAFARGKGRPADRYEKTVPLFFSCAGAAIYSVKILREIGKFDENHFCYLEDTDVGWKARINGYRNIFVPTAKVLHIGSATTGSLYNDFKVRNSSRNSIYLIYKNMPAAQIFLNLPILLFGFSVKAAFFFRRGFGGVYMKGIVNGFRLCRKGSVEGKKVAFKSENLPHYIRIQLELWMNCVRRLVG